MHPLFQDPELEKHGLIADETSARISVPLGGTIQFDVEEQVVIARIPGGVGQSSVPVPLPATTESIRLFVEHWVLPARSRLGAFNGGVPLLQSIARLRQGAPRRSLEGNNVRRRRFFAGIDHYEEGMISFENALTMYPWTVNPALKAATGDGGNVTQFELALSGAILSVERVHLPGWRTAGFCLQFEYYDFDVPIEESWDEGEARKTHGLPADARAIALSFGAKISATTVTADFERERTPATLMALISAAPPGEYALVTGDWIAEDPSEQLRETALFHALFRSDRDTLATRFANDARVRQDLRHALKLPPVL